MSPPYGIHIERCPDRPTRGHWRDVAGWIALVGLTLAGALWLVLS